MKAALLDENRVYLRMDEVEVPTERHLPQITSCDLPAGRYVWVPEQGAFVEVAWLERFRSLHQAKADAEAKAERVARLRAKRAH